MASLAQFAFNVVKGGISAREGLRQVRDAGLKVRDGTWFRMVGEARAHYSNRISELSRPQNLRPRGGEIGSIPTKAARGFRQYVDIWIKPRGADHPIIVTQAVTSSSLLSRQKAVDMAIAGYRAAQARRQTTGATLTTLPDAAIVGAIYTATLQFVPEDEFAPDPGLSAADAGSLGGSAISVVPGWRTVTESMLAATREGSWRPTPEGQAAWPRPSLVPDVATQTRIEGSLRDVITRLNAGRAREFVRLPALRDELTKLGLDHTMQDSAIMGLALQADARVINIANLKSLSNDDFRAAIWLGGEFKHAIAIGF